MKKYIISLTCTIGAELTVISALSKFGFDFNTLDSFYKVLIMFVVLVPVCILLNIIATKSSLKALAIVTRVVSVFIAVCFILASIVELKK